MAFGTFPLRVVDAVAFVRNFLPANARYYAFDSPEARQEISSELVKKLKDLVDTGILSQDEFDVKKSLDAGVTCPQCRGECVQL